MTKPKKRIVRRFLATVGGLMCCNVPDFDPATYQGLRKNCGRKPSAKALAALKAKLTPSTT